MTQQIFVSIDLIDANPWQPREHEDANAVAEIAASIERNMEAGVGTRGLLQVPMARKVGERYQLAFGHTRKAAFIHLIALDNGKADQFREMPLLIQDLTDLQMFEAANAENIKRQDLNPIEKARSMRRYLDDFGKTSEEAAQFFSVSPETVRGTVRLLNLPSGIQEKVRDGSFSVGTARKLLSVQNINAEAMQTAAAEILELDEPDAETIDRELQDAIKKNKHVVEMWESYRKREPRGGKNLWPLTWQHKGKIAPLTEELVIRALGLRMADLKATIEEGPDARTWKQAIEQMVALAKGGMEITVESFPLLAEHIARVQLLANPPACTTCPLYAKLGDTEYCGMKLCWERKAESWIEQDLKKMSKSLGIAVYNPATDGDTFVIYKETWGDQGEKHFAKKIKD